MLLTVMSCLRQRADYRRLRIRDIFINIIHYTYMYNVQCFKMADNNEKLLSELLKKSGNNLCADCGAKSKILF